MSRSRRSVLAVAVLLGAAPSILSGAAKGQGRPIRIGVIGAGSLGGTVGRAWVEAGHEVLFSSRHPEELRRLLGLPTGG